MKITRIKDILVAINLVREELLNAMIPYFSLEYENPSSLHSKRKRRKESIRIKYI